jgi:hypothetical protein
MLEPPRPADPLAPTPPVLPPAPTAKLEPAVLPEVVLDRPPDDVPPLELELPLDPPDPELDVDEPETGPLSARSPPHASAHASGPASRRRVQATFDTTAS